MLVIVTVVLWLLFGRRLRRGMLMAAVVMSGAIVGRFMSMLFCFSVPESCIVVTGTALLVAVVTTPRRICQQRFVTGSIEPGQTRHERHDRP